MKCYVDALIISKFTLLIILLTNILRINLRGTCKMRYLCTTRYDEVLP